MSSIEFKNQSDPFYKSLNQRVTQRLEEMGDHTYGNHHTFMKATFWFVLTVTFYILALHHTHHLGQMYLLGLASAFSLFFLIINTAHDAVHGSLTKNKILGAFGKYFLLNMLGVDGRMWSMRHKNSHHIFPNVKGCDADIDETAIIRLSCNAKHLWFHNYQHLYAPFIYAILNLHSVFYQDFNYLTKSEIANIKNIKHGPRDLALFVFNKIIYFSLWVFIPYFYTGLPFLTIFIGYMLITLPLSFAFMPIGIAHLNEHSAHFNPEIKQEIPTSFARYQVSSSVDFSPQSKLVTFLYGGLNAHAAHHLFPKLSHRHYSWITEVIVEECEKYHVPYRKMGFFESWKSHFKYLREVGQQKKDHNIVESVCS